MFCESPVTKISKNGNEYRRPCGKCRACRLRRANQKVIVGVFAAAEFKKKGQFLTLTYNDEHKPDGLNHDDFAQFMKKLRQNTGVKDLKMFMAGEYGEDGELHREHFHVLFFNHKFPIEEIEKAWTEPRKRGRKRKGDIEELIPLGFVYDGTCTPAAMKYCTGYVAKGGYDPQSGKRPPYGRFSCNIPDGLTGREIFQMCMTGKVRYNGALYNVPDTWRRRYHILWSDCRVDRSVYKNYVLHECDRVLTPDQVKDIMDQKEIKHLIKKSEKKKKRLQKILHRRIM